MKYYLTILICFLLFSCRNRAGIEPLTLSSEYTSELEVNTFGHKASFLANGSVFLSGAYEDNVFVHKMYSPEMRSWESVANSPNVFIYHGMTTLEDGRILLAGGYQKEYNSTARSKIGIRVQVFDPSNRIWTEAASLQIGRASFSLISLDNGKLMAIGGYSLEEVGSRTFALPNSSVEFYDPATDVWTLGPSMIMPRAEQEHVKLADGRILILGGNVNEFTGEVYDPTTNTWSAIASPSIGFRREYRAALLDDEHVILTGGLIEGVEGNRITMIYSISDNTWELAEPMNEERAGHTLLSLGDGRVLAMGGKSKLDDHPFYPTVESIKTCELYDMRSDSWRSVGNFQTERYGHVSVQLSPTEILSIGGSNEPGKGAELQLLN